MTEEERTFTHWFQTKFHYSAADASELLREAWMTAWKRERVKAEPFWFKTKTPLGDRMMREISCSIEKWGMENHIPEGTWFKVTLEEE